MTEPAVHCRVDAVEQAMRAGPLAAPELTAAVHAQVAAETRQLAHRAYDLNEPAAVAEAERILHVIHVNNHFDAPLQPLPAAIWSTLLRHRMQHALREPLPAIGTRSEAQTMLNQLVEQLGAFNHPLWDALAEDRSRESLVVYVKNWFGSTHGFTAQLACLSQRAVGALKEVVLENLSDELVGKATHDEIRTRFITALGLTFDATTAQHDPDRVTESFALSSFRAGATTCCDGSFGLGSFYSIEANYPHEARRMLALLRPRGFTEDSLETFWMHVDADEDHAGEWLSAMSDALTPDELAQAVWGAATQLRVRRQMFDAVYRRIYGKEPSR